MNPFHSETIRLNSNESRFYKMTEKTESDQLLYSISYDAKDEGKVLLAELAGEGSRKLVLLSLDTNEKVKTGDFTSHTAFSNIFFLVEQIRFFSEQPIEFHLTLLKR